MDKDIRLNYEDVKWKNDTRLKLLIIVGTRPEIIRLAAVIDKCRTYFDTILAHTGQNYDYNLNGIFFRDLGLDDPDVYMNAVGDDLGATVGNIINCSYRFETYCAFFCDLITILSNIILQNLDVHSRFGPICVLFDWGSIFCP